MKNGSRVKAYEIKFDTLWTMRKALLWLVIGFILLAGVTSAHAQDNQKHFWFNAKANDGYSKPVMKKQLNDNFSDHNLSAQLTIEFFINENKKLNKEINDLIERVNASSTRPLNDTKADIMRVAILKSKIEYFEVALKKWVTEGDF